MSEVIKKVGTEPDGWSKKVTAYKVGSDWIIRFESREEIPGKKGFMMPLLPPEVTRIERALRMARVVQIRELRLAGAMAKAEPAGNS